MHPRARADRAAYLEELIVRRELAINFVHYTPDYDRFSCLPAWAQKTLAEHAADRVRALYDRNSPPGGRHPRPLLECRHGGNA
jgi:deoxyribodipyrimidine photolyase